MKAVLILTLLVLIPGMGAGEAKELPKPLMLTGCENLIGIRYLPASRYTGDPGPRGDYEKTLNLYLPTGKPGPLPLVMYVHGGAYTAGHKDESYQAGLLQRLVDRGFAVGSLNYILGNGIMPRVFWDFEDCARFLRLNAATYRLDPTAFGAIGISAGGWLITSSGHADGTSFTYGVNNYIALDRMRGPEWAFTGMRSLQVGEAAIMRPVLSVDPAYPGVHGRWQAMAYDFAMLEDRANGFTPALMPFLATANGANDKSIPKHIAAAGIDYFPGLMTSPRWTKGIHAPPLSGTPDAATRRFDGSGDADLADVIADFFAMTLTGPQARTPVPELLPTLRLTTGPVEVSMVVADPGITVHYTTDGSEPTTASTVYAKPFTVAPGKTVRALAVMPGRRPSRPVEATWVESLPLPRVTAPDTAELPPAETGKPYEVRFASDVPGARFTLLGRLAPFEDKGSWYHPNTMRLSTDGVFSGTPGTPGTYLVEIWANRSVGGVGLGRTYRWTVTGKPVGPQTIDDVLKAEDNETVASLVGVNGMVVGRMRDLLVQAGLPALFIAGGKHASGKDLTLVLAPRAQVEAVRALLQKHYGSDKHTQIIW
jgi:hypothetical protein